MATFIRKNAWNHGGTFENPDLLWYAAGVRAMQRRSLDDPSGWWFFAALHGEYITRQNRQPGFPGWGAIPGPPAVPSTPLPTLSTTDRFWNQCQHQSWHFPPWHRGYLLALEAQIRAAVVAEQGPADWALPYWDYLGPDPQFDIPPAFTAPTLPDGTANPLLVKARFGPYGDGVIFVPTAAGLRRHPSRTRLSPGLVTQGCLGNGRYTGSDGVTPPPGFGGPVTSFHHGGGSSGNLESNPHNLVHVYVGGFVSNSLYGLMSDPGTAALDPIFYLHHANIDRLWALWNTDPAKTNPADQNWLDGPAASGGREFVMPLPENPAWVFTPRDVSRLSKLNYTYDNLPAPVERPLPERVERFGMAGAGVTGRTVELVGASQGSVPVTGMGVETSVQLDAEVRGRVSRRMGMAAAGGPPDRMYLNLDNVRGTHDAGALSVYVNVPAGAEAADHPELLAGSVGLFGLRRASAPDGQHAGTGLNFVLDVTGIADALHIGSGADLRVTIVPDREVPDGAAITVGRVSLYRQEARGRAGR